METPTPTKEQWRQLIKLFLAASRIADGIPTTKKRLGLVNSTLIFEGATMLKWMTNTRRMSKEDALLYCRLFLAHYFVVPFLGKKDAEPVEQNMETFREAGTYQLRCDTKQRQLNGFARNPYPPRKGTLVVKEIGERLDRVLEIAPLEQIKTVDFDRLEQHDDYADFLSLVLELQKVDLRLMTPVERRCFFINLINILSLHVQLRSANRLQRKLPPNPERFSYMMDGDKYSQELIMNGFLRGNKSPPGKPFKMLKSTDKSFDFVCEPDPRVHFLLAYYPPTVLLPFYSSINLPEELDSATRAFINTRVHVDTKNNTIRLHPVFKEYASDFGGGQAMDVCYWLIPRLIRSSQADMVSLLEQYERNEYFNIHIKFAEFEYTPPVDTEYVISSWRELFQSAGIPLAMAQTYAERCKKERLRLRAAREMQLKDWRAVNMKLGHLMRVAKVLDVQLKSDKPDVFDDDQQF